jgi:hypothetical protein
MLLVSVQKGLVDARLMFRACMMSTSKGMPSRPCVAPSRTFSAVIAVLSPNPHRRTACSTLSVHLSSANKRSSRYQAVRIHQIIPDIT